MALSGTCRTPTLSPCSLFPLLAFLAKPISAWPGNRLGDLPALTAHDRIVAVLEDPTRSPKGGAVKRARTSRLCGSANASNGLEDLMLKQGLLNPLESQHFRSPNSQSTYMDILLRCLASRIVAGAMVGEAQMPRVE